MILISLIFFSCITVTHEQENFTTPASPIDLERPERTIVSCQHPKENSCSGFVRVENAAHVLEDGFNPNNQHENDKMIHLWIKRAKLQKKMDYIKVSLNEDSRIAKIHAEAMIQRYKINDLSERPHIDISLHSESTFQNNISETPVQREIKQQRYCRLEELKKARVAK